MTIKAIEALAQELLVAKGGDKHSDKTLGKCWYSNFLARHPDLKSRRSRTLDQCKNDAVDYNTSQRWFELFRTTLLAHDIAEDDIYNMDEKGVYERHWR